MYQYGSSPIFQGFSALPPTGFEPVTLGLGNPESVGGMLGMGGMAGMK
jgi:hypothetical protein